jgi:hypothetical protein
VNLPIRQGEHPIAAGAQAVKFSADAAYEVTPLIQGFADALNQIAGKGFNKRQLNTKQKSSHRQMGAFQTAGLAKYLPARTIFSVLP